MTSSDKIDIGGLLGGSRQRLTLERDVPLEPFEGLSFGRPAHLRLDLHGAGDLLEITGTIDAAVEGECVRCLGEVKHEMRVTVDERLETGAKAQADPFGESNVLFGDKLDTGYLATQLVCSALPIGLLCSDECKGICPLCGENKNLAACTCAPVAVNGENKWRT